MNQTMTMTIPNLSDSITQITVDAALEAAQDWANAELKRLREELTPDPAITDLYVELNALLPPDTAPTTTDSNARDTLVRAIAEIKKLRQRVADTTWRQVADEPPPLNIDLLFWRGGSFWVGRVEEVTVHDSESGTKCLEVAYYYDGDYDDGDPPTAWCLIPAGDEDGEE